MKKGQVQIIFTWIFILILAGAILVYGIKMVRDTQKLGEDVLVINFLKNFEKRVKTYYYLSIGSSGVEEFSLPNDVGCICFTKDGTMDFDSSNIQFKCGDDKENLLESLREYDNVFVFSDKSYSQNRMNVSFLYVEDNPTCVKVSGGLLRVRLENIGRDGVNVSNP